MYGMRRKVLSSPAYVEVSEEQVTRLKVASETLVEVAYVEQLFDILIGNYIEVERECLNCALDDAAYWHKEHVDFHSVMSLMNRRITNFLSSGASYRDHINSVLSNADGFPDDAETKFKEYRSSVFGSSFSYRVIEAVRNYSQHKRMPVTKFSIGGAWEGGERTQRRHTMRIYLESEKLVEDKRATKWAKKDLAGKGDVDIMECVSGYIDGVCSIHARFRDIVRGSVEHSFKEIESGIETWRTSFPGEPVDPLVAFKQEGQKVTEVCPVYDGAKKIIDFLQKKNPAPHSFSTLCIASRPAGKEQ